MENASGVETNGAEATCANGSVIAREQNDLHDGSFERLQNGSNCLTGPKASASAADLSEECLSSEKRNSEKAEEKKKKPTYIYGNYPHYYGYRVNGSFTQDARFSLLRREWFHGRDCIDVGCNDGTFTIGLALHFSTASMLGIDIDEGLVREARRHLREAAAAHKTRRTPMQHPPHGSAHAHQPCSRAGDWHDASAHRHWEPRHTHDLHNQPSNSAAGPAAHHIPVPQIAGMKRKLRLDLSEESPPAAEGNAATDSPQIVAADGTGDARLAAKGHTAAQFVAATAIDSPKPEGHQPGGAQGVADSPPGSADSRGDAVAEQGASGALLPAQAKTPAAVATARAVTAAAVTGDATAHGAAQSARKCGPPASLERPAAVLPLQQPIERRSVPRCWPHLPAWAAVPRSLGLQGRGGGGEDTGGREGRVGNNRQEAAVADVAPSSEQALRNVRFVCRNILEGGLDLCSVDTITCLSVTKWVHLNWGDAGLTRLFSLLFLALRPGGVLLLEPQPWSSYKRYTQITPESSRHYKEARIFPHMFREFLLDKIGFSHGMVLVERRNVGKNVGFNRPFFAFFK